MIDFKTTVYWRIYSDVFAFHKKFADVREEDDYWQQVVDEAGVLFKKYENIPESEFAKSLLLAVCGEIERSYKATNVHNGNT